VPELPPLLVTPHASLQLVGQHPWRQLRIVASNFEPGHLHLIPGQSPKLEQLLPVQLLPPSSPGPLLEPDELQAPTKAALITKTQCRRIAILPVFKSYPIFDMPARADLVVGAPEALASARDVFIHSCMRFDASLRERWTEADGAFHFEMPADWMQGRSVFGGLSTAALVALAHRSVSPGRVLRTISVQLLRPTLPGSLSGSARVVRDGRSTSFLEGALARDGAETARASMIFVAPRAVATNVAGPAPFSGEKDVEALPELPYLPGVTPEFTKHIALRWASGDPPFSGSAQARFDGYCRFRGPAGDVEGVLGLLDMWPCPSLSVLTTPRFASTVTWTAHVFAVPESFEQWFSFSYQTIAGKDGFHTAVGRLHTADGTLIGFTEQLVAVFD
jgi:acyl-CoA thioesterase